MTSALRAKDRLIVALDETSLSGALHMAQALRGLVRTVKVGSVLFTASGPEAVRRLRALGFEVMLDLKFFDIPSTVELSCRSAATLRVSWLTVHASGGREMLQAAVRGAGTGRGRPRVLAVTVLTSTPNPATIRGGPETLGGPRATANIVRTLAYAAFDAKCDGVVASAHEAADLRKTFRGKLMIVCPGIRPASAFREDQRRVATPSAALRAGADRLVVGRPITGARRPREAAQAILDEMEERAC
jgi:orotidine-5'-phosphate decarboxylase